jgi:hypothetical protein
MRTIQHLFILAIFFLGACNGKQDKVAGTQIPEAAVQAISVHDLLQDPGKYVDQAVVITGTVTHVCKHAGKRLHLTGAQEGETIRVEAGEAISRFERELEGSMITAHGILRSSAAGTGHEEGHQHGGDEMAEEAECSSSETVNYWLDGQSFTVEKEI